MSEENAPKLRLKPKLAAEPTSAQAQPAAETSPLVTDPTPVESGTETEAPKPFRLKPKLAPAPAEEAAAATPADAPAPAVPSAEVEPVRLKPRVSTPPMETPAPAADPASTDAPQPEPAAKPAFKLGLKPKTAEPQPAPTPEAPAEPAEAVEPAVAASPVLAAPPPSFKAPATGENGPAAGASFPAPGKFPPPPGLKKALDEASKEAAKSGKPASPAKKKRVMLIGGLVFVLVLAGGGFVAFQKFTAEPAPEPRPKLVAKPVTVQGQAVATAQKVVEQAKAQAAEPINEILNEQPKTGAVTAATKEPVQTAEEKPLEPAKPSLPPPPPAPSTAFRGWVENLKISGMRGGANPKIFVGGTTYQPGDLVNPQLGVIFEDYIDDTRTIVFKDKTGARLERRN
jgi:hypothetical protein